jgi:hypothetical protein
VVSVSVPGATWDMASFGGTRELSNSKRPWSPATPSEGGDLLAGSNGGSYRTSQHPCTSKMASMLSRWMTPALSRV